MIKPSVGTLVILLVLLLLTAPFIVDAGIGQPLALHETDIWRTGPVALPTEYHIAVGDKSLGPRSLSYVPDTRGLASLTSLGLPPPHDQIGSLNPQAAVPPLAATQVTTGDAHTCALTDAGGVKCWGANGNGQLGDGTIIWRLTPVDVVGLDSGVIAVAAGGGHTCALTTGGVKCWGSNYWGQLGDGTRDDRLTPVDVVGLDSGVTAVTASGARTCALTIGGGVKCWGSNTKGGLGDGTRDDRLTPVDVVGLDSGVTDVVTGMSHTCAVASGGRAKCWGWNGNGQLGDGTTIDRLTPVDVVGLGSGVTAVTAGNWHSCALVSSGGVKCWGSNGSGALGVGAPSPDHRTPVDVVGLSSGATAVSTRTNHTCALTSSGGVKCWGANTYGQLGDGTKANRYAPVSVVGLHDGMSAVGTGNGFTCALSSGGGIMCWGWNDLGQLGDGTTTDHVIPVAVVGFGGTPASDLSITHIEIIQATQDELNAIPLIAGKPTLVRVYVDCGDGCTSLPNVTGFLHGFGSWAQLPDSPLESRHQPITAYHEDWRDQRGNLRKTLNFELPEEWRQDTIMLVAEVAGILRSETVTFQHAPQPRIVYVPIKHNEQVPNLDRIVKASGWARQLFPTAKISYAPGYTFEWNRCVQRETWSCPLWGKNMANLLNRLTTLYERFPDAYVFGWLPEGSIGGGQSDPDWDGGANIAAIGDDHPTEGPRIFAHEIAHLMGERHANTSSCAPDYIDSDSDWIKTYDDSFIQDYGLDWLPRARIGVKKPTDTYEYMSYCGTLTAANVWTSGWTYSRIYSRTLDIQAAVQNRILSSPQTYFIASGLVFADNTVSLDPIWVITSTITPRNPMPGTEYCLEAQEASGMTLTEHCFNLTFVNYDTGEAMDVAGFNVMLPYPEGVAQIILRRSADELVVQPVSAHAPSLTVLSPNGGETWSADGAYPVAWTASDADDDPLTYMVFYSPNGSDWIPVSDIITHTQVVVRAAELAGSIGGRIRVLASDGVNTTFDYSDAPFTVESKAPQAFIIAPKAGSAAIAGMSLWLEGYGYDLEDGVLDDAALSWSSSRDGSLGKGVQLLTSLSMGQHSLTFSATDSDANTATTSVSVLATFEEDVVADCQIDVLDIQDTANRWQQRIADIDWDGHFDLDGDGIITVVDIMRVAAVWGSSCE